MAQEKQIYVDGHLVNFSSGAGYPTIWVNGKNTLVHRYVWEKVHGKIPKGFHIHHIDGDRKNFSLKNLHLISASEHGRQHAIKKRLGHSNKGKPKKHASGFCGKPKRIFAIHSFITLHFQSVSEASRVTGVKPSNISRILTGKRKTYFGWRFVYE